MSILILAEHDGQALNPATAKTVTCAAAMGGPIDILVLGSGMDAVAAQAAQLHEVPVLVRDFDDVEVLEIAIIENIQRENLTPPGPLSPNGCGSRAATSSQHGGSIVNKITKQNLLNKL